MASLLLSGFTTIEVLASGGWDGGGDGSAVGHSRGGAEGLVTDPWLRAGWILLVLALIRPLTWIPYLLPFLAFRRLFDALMPRRGVTLRNALANVATVATLGAVAWLLVAAVEGAGTDLLSAMAFATGSGSYDTLGRFRGDWSLGRVAAVVAIVVLGRVGLPPLGPDLDLSKEPVLGFAEGMRGTVDRYLLAVAVAIDVLFGGLAVVLART